MKDQTKFDTWAVVDIAPGVQIVGKCTEENIIGTTMLRIDVPENNGEPAQVHLFNNSTVLAIHPISEEIAKTWRIILSDIRQSMEKSITK